MKLTYEIVKFSHFELHSGPGVQIANRHFVGILGFPTNWADYVYFKPCRQVPFLSALKTPIFSLSSSPILAKLSSIRFLETYLSDFLLFHRRSRCRQTLPCRQILRKNKWRQKLLLGVSNSKNGFVIFLAI